MMKRAPDPMMWLPFGAGGMLAALIAPVMVFITGIAVPLGFLLPHDTMSYANTLAFAQNIIGKLVILVVIALFTLHGTLRLFHCFHDVGMHVGETAKFAFFGFSLLVSLVALILLLSIGF
ncbi:MAG: fumarate reductase subunit D [Acetobacteraceae bacterium]|nr:fumarate reductase subunit D [Acetobacteraceae bacterium]